MPGITGAVAIMGAQPILGASRLATQSGVLAPVDSGGGPGAFARITEDGQTRITEDGQTRVTEDAP